MQHTTGSLWGSTQGINRNFAASISMLAPSTSALNTIPWQLILSSFPFYQMASQETSSIFTATAHCSDVVSVVLQQEDGQSAVVAEVAASTLVSASPTEVASEVNTPSACAQPSQVNSLTHLGCFSICYSLSFRTWRPPSLSQAPLQLAFRMKTAFLLHNSRNSTMQQFRRTSMAKNFPTALFLTRSTGSMILLCIFAYNVFLQ